MKIAMMILFGVSLIGLAATMYYWGKIRERERESKHAQLRAFVQALPGWQPQIMSMHLDRYSYLEIAAKLNMPVKYVLTELSRAFAALRVSELENETPNRKHRRNLQARLIWTLLRKL